MSEYPEIFHATSERHKWEIFLAFTRKAGFRIGDLEKLLADEKAAESKRLATQRTADEKAKALLSVEQEAHRLEILKREYPFRRIEQPRGWAKEDSFKINEKTGALEAQCDCKHKFVCYLVPGEDTYWDLTHSHKWFSKGGEARGVGTKIGGSVGCWLDRIAMSYAFANPDAPLRLSDRCPEEFRQRRPMI
jgi:hypothetical protein